MFTRCSINGVLAPVICRLKERESVRPTDHLGLGEGDSGGGGEAGEVMLHVLEDEVERVRDARHHDPLEAHHIRVGAHPTESGDLPRHEAHALRLRGLAPHLLQRHHPAAPHLPRLVHVTVRPGPNLCMHAHSQEQNIKHSERRHCYVKDRYNKKRCTVKTLYTL